MDERFIEYDRKGNLIYRKDHCGYEQWFKYDKNNKHTNITEQEYKEIKRKNKIYIKEKIYTKFTRFEIMEI